MSMTVGFYSSIKFLGRVHSKYSMSGIESDGDRENSRD